MDFVAKQNDHPRSQPHPAIDHISNLAPFEDRLAFIDEGLHRVLVILSKRGMDMMGRLQIEAFMQPAPFECPIEILFDVAIRNQGAVCKTLRQGECLFLERIIRHHAIDESKPLRLERIELALDSVVSVQQRHEQELDGLMEIIQRSAAETAQRFQDTGERLNALIKIVDGIIQRPPPPPAS